MYLTAGLTSRIVGYVTGKQAYRKFLKSAFWIELSARKKSLVGGCEKCGRVDNLQSHHTSYPKDWYETTLGQLQVLCRRCHRRAHGLAEIRNIAILDYRDDGLFNRIIHRCHHLINVLLSGRGLRPRDEAFLSQAEKAYPPTKKDRCIQFQVDLVRKLGRWHLTGDLS